MNNKHHYSIYVSDPAAQKLLERQENKSGFIAQLITDYANGDVAPTTDLKQRKLAAEAGLAEAKLRSFDEDRELKREAMRADINLKVQAGHMSSMNFQRALANMPGSHRVKQYILPNGAGDALDMFCPVCLKVTASSVHVNEKDYTRAKTATVVHAINVHGGNGARFDATFPEFGHFENIILGKRIYIAATQDQLDDFFKPGAAPLGGQLPA